MRLSRRLPDSLEENDLALALRARAVQGGDLVDLTVSNPTDCDLPTLEARLRPLLDAPSLWRYRPDPHGDLEVREAIAAYHQGCVTPGHIIPTASTSEAYSWLFKLLGDPGDEVLVPTPSYPLFTWLARLEGMTAVPVPSWWHDRWMLDLAAIEAARTPRTRALVVVNPNNPTGQLLSSTEWSALLEWASRHDVALLVDEVFLDYLLEPAEASLGSVLGQGSPEVPVFVLSGLSKVAALPQVKLGWIAAHGGPAERLLPALTFLADQYLSVSASAQVLGVAALAHRVEVQSPLQDRLRGNLRILDHALDEHPHLSRLPVEGGWSVLLRRPAVSSGELCAERLICDHGVRVHPGCAFDLPGEQFLVLSLLPAPGVFVEGLARLFQGLKGPDGCTMRSANHLSL